MPKKLSVEDIKKDIESLKDNNCILLGVERKSTKSKNVWVLKLKCECNREFFLEYNSFKKKKLKTCGKCVKLPSSRKFSIEEVQQQINKIGFNMLSEVYVNNSVSLKLSCKKGHVFYRSLSLLKDNPICPVCKYNEDMQRYILDKLKGRFIPQEFIYNDSKKYKFKDLKCNKVFDVTIKTLLYTGSCPYCDLERIKNTTLTFKQTLKDLFGDNYQLIGEYRSNYITLLHKKCGHYISVSPESIKSSNGNLCYVCNSSSLITHYDFVEKVNNMCGNLYSVLGVYTKTHTKIRMRHNTCMHEWEVTPAHFLNGNRCPRCRSYSSGELKIIEYLKNNNMSFETQYTFNDLIFKKELRFDFAIFNKDGNLKLLCEYHGRQHYEKVNFNGINDKLANKIYKETLIRDDIKYQYCKDNEIDILYIKYTDYNNIEEILSNIKI